MRRDGVTARRTGGDEPCSEGSWPVRGEHIDTSSYAILARIPRSGYRRGSVPRRHSATIRGGDGLEEVREPGGGVGDQLRPPGDAAEDAVEALPGCEVGIGCCDRGDEVAQPGVGIGKFRRGSVGKTKQDVTGPRGGAGAAMPVASQGRLAAPGQARRGASPEAGCGRRVMGRAGPGSRLPAEAAVAPARPALARPKLAPGPPSPFQFTDEPEGGRGEEAGMSRSYTLGEGVAGGGPSRPGRVPGGQAPLAHSRQFLFYYGQSPGSRITMTQMSRCFAGIVVWAPLVCADCGEALQRPRRGPQPRRCARCGKRRRKVRARMPDAAHEVL